jgi:hypothetical protein
MIRFTTIAVASALVGASGLTARADGPTTADSSESVPDELVLPKGKLLLDAFLEMNLSSGEVFKPVSITPDLWYGVTDDLTLGLVHSGTGANGFIGAVGNSLCLGSSCTDFYNDVGIDARIRLTRPWAVDAGLYVLNFSNPFELAAKIGISGRWTWHNKLALELQPSLFIGFTDRNPTNPAPPAPAAKPNTEELYVPVTLSYMVAPKVDLALQTGLVLPFSNAGNSWAIPISIAIRYAVNGKFGIGLAFTFPDLIGGASTADERTLTLGGTYAF